MKISKYIKFNICKIISLIIVASLFLPAASFAHQPRITEGQLTEVTDPEISKAYYGELSGVLDTYVIRSNEAFNLYVNILVPDIAGQDKVVSVRILKDGEELIKLDGPNFIWEKFYEPFGADTYWMGPEYRARVTAGTYEIQVSSPKNDSKYSLAIGEIEAFDMKEGINALTLIPKLKTEFFNESPIGFIVSPFGWGLIVAMYFLAFMAGIIYRFILKRMSKGTVRGLHKNIGTSDRMLRIAIGLGLLVLAIATTWNPILIFFSGFAIFEGIFSWCGLYAALGKNTCPIK